MTLVGSLATLFFSTQTVEAKVRLYDAQCQA